MKRFEYILEKIRHSSFSSVPFECIIIKDFFNDKDFNDLVNDPQVKINGLKSAEALISSLNAFGYKPVQFPGAITDEARYLDWLNKGGEVYNQDTCESFGITYRLSSFKSEILKELNDFFNSNEFYNVLMEKFQYDGVSLSKDFGLQKYLKGYEISPHPDIRRKALTFMININPNENSEKSLHHTHLMEFNDTKKYIYDFWKYNSKINRCWVPWEWCKTVKLHNDNNSIIIFKPNYNTLHAVKANYDHLKYQRTQMYGNLWFNEGADSYMPNWKELVLIDAKTMDKHFDKVNMKRKYFSRCKKIIPAELKEFIKSKSKYIRKKRY